MAAGSCLVKRLIEEFFGLSRQPDVTMQAQTGNRQLITLLIGPLGGHPHDNDGIVRPTRYRAKFSVADNSLRMVIKLPDWRTPKGLSTLLALVLELDRLQDDLTRGANKVPQSSGASEVSLTSAKPDHSSSSRSTPNSAAMSSRL
ncbi:hypothetical protein [Alloactinosynnema sp. L-07]|uniref:hypothetical protein n=1 Tax=Alloactinosynnema sp. L-07 TaxID=1653480 RepID=UPI0012FB7D36|nr:hypothetical protein [Alloactinosynnema sp. L-07]